MKNLFFILTLILFYTACNNKTDQPAPSEKPVGTTSQVYWEITDTGRLSMMRFIGGGPDTLSAESIVAFINTRYPRVQLSFVKMSHDTVFLKIPEPTYLTQQMGSSGPVTFFAEVVYDLTEIPHIVYVDFDFEEGDHAQPGTLYRGSFKDQ
ncbi:MAG TPA: hypothetical protein VGO58_07280 [Chitinophagaceae bacterium]|jgi:hypothetical protein|nr:hypothetical protein [Chitinophagaceae bacterium]